MEGTRIFSLELDEETTIAKISRGFDSLATNNELTVKIASKLLPNLPTHRLFELMVRDSFKRNKEFEITQVFKGTDQEHAYVIASSPDQHNKIIRLSLAVDGELIEPTPTREKLTTTAIARKNCLVLIAKNLNKGVSATEIEEGLKTLIGDRNVINVYFPRAKRRMHTGIANVELLNASIYKKFVQKTHKFHGKYVCFNPHPRSLDGTTAPLEEALSEHGSL